mmetsp:Transcript_20706/g.54305  ORF Transcript_20706/g.54305 Transcript_20706/m.54305 type:complete len:201 (-) Transcript_20706:206-808(-)
MDVLTSAVLVRMYLEHALPEHPPEPALSFAALFVCAASRHVKAQQFCCCRDQLLPCSGHRGQLLLHADWHDPFGKLVRPLPAPIRKVDDNPANNGEWQASDRNKDQATQRGISQPTHVGANRQAAECAVMHVAPGPLIQQYAHLECQYGACAHEAHITRDATHMTCCLGQSLQLQGCGGTRGHRHTSPDSPDDRPCNKCR